VNKGKVTASPYYRQHIVGPTVKSRKALKTCLKDTSEASENRTSVWMGAKMRHVVKLPLRIGDSRVYPQRSDTTIATFRTSRVISDLRFCACATSYAGRKAQPNFSGVAEGFGEAVGHFGEGAGGAPDELAESLAADAQGLGTFGDGEPGVFQAVDPYRQAGVWRVVHRVEGGFNHS
jgi:hypothetical protein